MPKNEETNGQLTENIQLSLQQADLFKRLLAVSNEAHVANAEAQNQIQIAMVAAGIADREIVGGDLDVESPYFTVKNGVVEQE